MTNKLMVKQEFTTTKKIVNIPYKRHPYLIIIFTTAMLTDDIVFGGCIVMFTALKGGHFEGLAETRLFDATPDLMIEFSVRNLLEDGLSEFILFDVIRRRKSL